MPPSSFPEDPAAFAEIAIPGLVTTTGKQGHSRGWTEFDQLARKGERAGGWIGSLPRGTRPPDTQEPQAGTETRRPGEKHP
jgi:hypothetical protein